MKEKDIISPFINIKLSDQLSYYKKIIDLINDIVENPKSFRILPVLNRILLENLLRDIISSSLEGKYNSLYYNQSRGRVRNFSALLDVFIKLRKNFRESYAVDIPDEIISNLDKFRKDGNYSSHELTIHIKPYYANEIKDDFSITVSILIQLYQKIINSGKKITEIDEKFLKIDDKKLKNVDISNVLRLISSLRNEIVNFDTENDIKSINLEEKERLQDYVNKLHLCINKMDLSTDSILGIVKNLSYFELNLHSEKPNKQSLLNYIDYLSVYFKANLIYVSRNDRTIVEQMIKLKNQKTLIIFLTIVLFIFMGLVIIGIFFRKM